MKLKLFIFTLTFSSSINKTLNDNSNPWFDQKLPKISCSSDKPNIAQLNPFINEIIEEWETHKLLNRTNNLISYLKVDKLLTISGKIEEPQSIRKTLKNNLLLLKLKLDQLSICISKLSSDRELFKNELFNFFRNNIKKVYSELNHLIKELEPNLNKIKVKLIRNYYKSMDLVMNIFIETSLKLNQLKLDEKSSKILSQDDLRKKELSSQLKYLLKS